MANPVVLEDCKVYLGGYDLTGSLRQLRLGVMRAELSNGRFGDLTEVFWPGLLQVETSGQGFFTAGAGEPDAVIPPRLLTPDRTDWPLTVAPPDAPGAAGVDGNICYSVHTCQFGYETGGDHGVLLPYTVTSKIRQGSPYRQTIMLPKATYAVTTTGTIRQLGAVSAAQKLVTVLHVFTVTGGTWTLTVESDNLVGFGTPTTRQTFTGATAITRQVVETAGPITDDFFRVVLTKAAGTSAVAFVSTSIENLP